MVVAALICFAIALWLTLTVIYSLACWIICALMIKPDAKPLTFKFKAHWIYNYGVSVLVLAGALLLYFS